MDYMYKPPTERNSFLIPLTEGCPYNKCRFCATYKNTELRVFPLSSVESYIKEHLTENSRVYFVGADPLCLSDIRTAKQSRKKISAESYRIFDVCTGSKYKK